MLKKNDLLNEEHYYYKIHTSLTEKSAYHVLQTPPSHMDYLLIFSR